MVGGTRILSLVEKNTAYVRAIRNTLCSKYTKQQCNALIALTAAVTIALAMAFPV